MWPLIPEVVDYSCGKFLVVVVVHLKDLTQVEPVKEVTASLHLCSDILCVIEG